LLTEAQLRQIRLDRARARQSREVAHRLWSVLSLECWARQFLSKRQAAPTVTTIGPA
jgi:hypothetical protein